MALETGTYISDLVTTNPAGTDTLDKADDHLRLIKSTIKATFPNLAGPTALSTVGTAGASIISVTDNTNAALRITQLGTGNALLVEDSANPDSTPTVIDANGRLITGHTAAISFASGLLPQIQNMSTSAGTSVIGTARFSADAGAPSFALLKSRSTTLGTLGTIVSSGDSLGSVSFFGDDGSGTPISGAQIVASVDGTPGASDMPGRLTFSTTADGASTPTERMRIRSDGNIGIGTSGDVATSLYIGKSITGGTTAHNMFSGASIKSDVTGAAYGYRTYFAPEAAAFTLSGLIHYAADQYAFGAGSSVTSQYGFLNGAANSEATNNYGFYAANTAAVAAGKSAYGFFSNVNTATGGGTTWAFYGAGTATSYFAGSVGIGTTSPSQKLDVSGNINATGTVVMGSSFLRNRIINGDMRIDQRNAGASVTPTTTGTYTLDRWFANLSVTSKYSVQQQTSVVPTGHSHAVKITSLSAYSVGAAEQFALLQGIEGLNFSDFGFGTANAQSVTLSFWVYSSLTGTFGGSLQNGAANRSYPFTYSIGSASTWTKISVTIPGDTTGTWPTDSTAGAYLSFGLGVGTTLSGTAGAWAAANYRSATGAVSVVGTNAATWYITGVQLEAGSVATPFERRQFGQELALCQRYCENIVSLQYFTAFANTSTTVRGVMRFTTTKRAVPTVTTSGGFIFNANGNTFNISAANLSAVTISQDSAYLQGTSAALTPGWGGMIIDQASSGILVSAEL